MVKQDSRALLAARGASALALALATPGYAQSNDTFKIGVIAEVQAVAGSSIPQAAQLAADEQCLAGDAHRPADRDVAVPVQDRVAQQRVIF